MPMPSLETLLKTAARTTDWQHDVLHRCAWCGRVADANGDYREAPTHSRLEFATTDGMCPTCAAEAEARLAARAVRRQAA